jgi:phosphate butyryltransferase
VNPAHLDPVYAETDMFHRVIAHGMWGAGLISAILGTELPGPGAIYLGQSLRFTRPVGVGDTITACVTVAQKRAEHHVIVLDCTCVNQKGETVISGQAEVKAPTEKVSRPRMPLPDVRIASHDRFRQLMARARTDLRASRPWSIRAAPTPCAQWLRPPTPASSFRFSSALRRV